MTGQRIRLGMVGGGAGAFIGDVHRIAARLDNHYELVAGCLSSDPDRALSSAQDLSLEAERSYTDYAVMARAEAARDDGIDVVAIVTPNHLHYPVARCFLEAGIHVICDKPLTLTAEESRLLRECAESANRILAVTYNYSGYPLVREARARIAAGELGNIRQVQVEYAQDWLADPIEASGQKQAEWRTDPTRSGAGGCIGDIGTHAFQLAAFVTGLNATRLCADLTTFVDGRVLDDNAAILLHFDGGAKGMLWASQVAIGCENGLSLRVYGDQGGLSWRQEAPNELWFTRKGEPTQKISRGSSATSVAAERMTRIPGGHPEGYLEAFANVYSEVAHAIRAHGVGSLPADGVVFPTGEDGLNGLRFIEAAVASHRANATWVDL